MRSVRGNIHQGYPFFSDIHAGRQCTAIAYIALIFFTIAPGCNWQSVDLDTVVRLGHSLFVNVTKELDRTRNPQNLLHGEVSGRDVHTQYGYGAAILDNNRYYGIVGNNADVNVGSHDLYESLNDIFVIESYQGALITIGDLSFALFRSRRLGSEVIYAFDSHARSMRGTVEESGRSVLLEFPSVIECYEYLLHMYYGQQFDISPASVQSVTSNYEQGESIHQRSLASNLPIYRKATMSDTITYVRTRASPHINSTYMLNEFQENSFTGSNHTEMHRSLSRRTEREQVCNTCVTNAGTENTVELLNASLETESRTLYQNCTRCPEQVQSSNGSNVNEQDSTILYSETLEDYSLLVEVPQMVVNSECMDHIMSYLDPNIVPNKSVVADKSPASVCKPIGSNHTYVDLGFNTCNNDVSDVVCSPEGVAETSSGTGRADLHLGEIDGGLPTNNSELFSGSGLASHRNAAYTNINEVYQKHIEMIPSFSCKCCERIMFKDQLFRSNVIQPLLRITNDDLVCITCKRTLHKNKIPTLAVTDNNLAVACIPKELKDLTMLEKRLISKVSTFFTLLLLPGYPVGQFAEKGYVIHFPVNTSSISTQLLSTNNFRNRIMVVACSCQNRLTPYKLIRPNRVIQALLWLKDHNSLYHDLELPDLDQHHYESSNITNSTDNIDLTEMSAVPSNYTSNHTIIDLNADNPIELYDVNFSEEMAFPWLFPNGINGYKTTRPRTLTLNQYLKSRLLNVDSRWRKDISYLINAVNIYEKKTTG